MSMSSNASGKSSPAEKCPACGAQTALRIIYGYPSPELLLDARQGRVALGGCVTTVWKLNGKEITFDPDWRCGDCAHKWQDEANKLSPEEMRAWISRYSQSPTPE